MARPRTPDMENSCSRGQLTRGCPPSWGLGEELTTSHRKRKACYEMLHRASEFVTSFCEHGDESSTSIKGEVFLD
jgi:hypothetical protein